MVGRTVNMRRTATIVIALLLVSACGKTDSESGSESGDRSSAFNTPMNTDMGAAGTEPAQNPVSDFGNTMKTVDLDPVIMVQPGLDEDTCARADVFVDRIRPRIVFLVDASASMGEDFGGVSRWDALRDALLADDGLVKDLEELAKFGLVTYEGPRFITCPSYRFAAPAPVNYQYVDSAFPMQPPPEGTSATPTGEAMNWAIDHAFLDQTASPDGDWETQFMIFATDGEPNGCAAGATDEPPRDFESVLAAANKAASRGIKIYVISLAEATGEFADHLAEVAAIGQTDTVYSPQNKEDLISELKDIVGATVSCDIALTAGRVKLGAECKGELTMNGQELECGPDAADGWELLNETTIQLKGSSCDTFRLTPSTEIRASFPCEALL
jgi:Mg-chelatase subunit ChlD